MSLTFVSKADTRRHIGAAMRSCVNAQRQCSAFAAARRRTPLGCGREGCVYALPHNRVLKLTISEEERAFSEWLVNERRTWPLPEMLPRIESAGPLIIRDEPVMVYRDIEVVYIVREGLASIPIEAFSGKNDVWLIMHALYYFAAMHLSRDIVSRDDAQEAKEKIQREAEIGRFRSETHRENARAALALVAWLERRRVTIRDLHQDNWGWRPATGSLFSKSLGLLVMRDLGFAALPALGAYDSSGEIVLRPLRRSKS